MYLLSAEQMRAIDRRAIEDLGLPILDLMEKAGLGVALAARQMLGGELEGKTIAVLCGKGNNGGDGLVAARYLAQGGGKVTIYLLARATELAGAAKTNLTRAQEAKIRIVELSDAKQLPETCDLFIDAIVGTGFQGTLTSLAAEVLQKVSSSERAVLAVDIPSGVDATTGEIKGPVAKARKTVTFAWPKVGQFLFPGKFYSGEVQVVDIGIPKSGAEPEKVNLHLLTKSEIAQNLPLRKPDGHKGTFGKVLVIAGSEGLTGAACLASLAALRSGCGIVILGCPESLNDIFEIKLTEVMSRPLPEVKHRRVLSLRSLGEILKLMEWADVVALGPGVGTHHETQDLVRRLLMRIEKPVVLDADGINALAKDNSALKNRTHPTIVTPHVGELARLLSESPEELNRNRIESARQAARELNCIVVFKGAPTLIGEPSGNVYLNPTGNSGMATAGSGDVLTGAIAGIWAQGAKPVQAACAGVFLHGLAGDLSRDAKNEYSLIAGDILDHLPQTISSLFS